jgi:hypothetical protein
MIVPMVFYKKKREACKGKIKNVWISLLNYKNERQPGGQIKANDEL